MFSGETTKILKVKQFNFLLINFQNMKGPVVLYSRLQRWHLGGFQLLDLIITELKSHMTC